MNNSRLDSVHMELIMIHLTNRYTYTCTVMRMTNAVKKKTHCTGYNEYKCWVTNISNLNNKLWHEGIQEIKYVYGFESILYRIPQKFIIVIK